MRLCHSALQEGTAQKHREKNIQYDDDDDLHEDKNDQCCNCGFLVSIGKLLHVISLENDTCRVESDTVFDK